MAEYNTLISNRDTLSSFNSFSDNNMPKYNTDFLNQNIKSKMKEFNISQNVLADKLGINQSRVSQILSNKSGASFSISQLVQLSNIFNTTPNELLGVTTSDKPVINNLSEVAKFFFALSDIMEISVHDIELSDFPQYSGFPKSCEGQRCAIFFDNPTLNAFFKTWEGLSTSYMDDYVRKELFSTWKEKEIEVLKDCTAKTLFQPSSLFNCCRLSDGWKSGHTLEELHLTSTDLEKAFFAVQSPSFCEQTGFIDGPEEVRSNVLSFFRLYSSAIANGKDPLKERPEVSD